MLESSHVWEALFLKHAQPLVKVEECVEMDDANVFNLLLRCELMHPFIGDFAHIESVKYVKAVRVVFELWTPAANISFAELAGHLQYSVTSLLLNLEYKFPFIFSHYGKHLFHINYKNLLKVTLLLAKPFDKSYIPDHNKIVHLVLFKLQAAIMSEFNTLNIMKECDIYKHKAQLCRDYLKARAANETFLDNSRRSFKLKPWDLRLFLDLQSFLDAP